MNDPRLPAPEVEKIASELIQKHFTELTEIRIEYFFIDKETLKNGRRVWAQVQKHGGKVAYLCSNNERLDDPFFSMQVSKPIWDNLTPIQKEATVHHELSHLDVRYKKNSDEPILSTRPHDIQEFITTANLYGTYKDDIKEIYKALKYSRQTPTLFDDESEDEVKHD